MRLKVSLKNSKIGEVPNISLTPGLSCVPGIPCFTEGCYARGAYDRWKNVRNAWDSNLEFYKEDPDRFFLELDDWMYDNRPVRFRLFVGGDFPDESFYKRVEDLTRCYLNTEFLAFTKRYDYDYKEKPTNMQIILSTWPGLALPTNTNLPWSWLAEDPRRPKDAPYVSCPGGCDSCGHACWSGVSVDLPVVFKKHR